MLGGRHEHPISLDEARVRIHVNHKEDLKAGTERLNSLRLMGGARVASGRLAGTSLLDT